MKTLLSKWQETWISQIMTQAISQIMTPVGSAKGSKGNAVPQKKFWTSPPVLQVQGPVGYQGMFGVQGPIGYQGMFGPQGKYLDAFRVPAPVEEPQEIPKPKISIPEGVEPFGGLGNRKLVM